MGLEVSAEDREQPTLHQIKVEKAIRSASLTVHSPTAFRFKRQMQRFLSEYFP